MKVILQEDVKGLGKKADLVEVAEGYARNYLLPRGLAVSASAGRMKELDQRQRVEKRKKDREKEEAQDLARKIEPLEVKIQVRCGEGGKLFGSVTSREIAEVLAKEHGLHIDRKQLEVKDAIKNLGRFTVNARLYPGVQAAFTVVVEAEENA